ncbi:hypothetical protein SSX86_028266 [Deinandra increscens subsp. villosa]|uniref:WRKY domain-containing protein n=1 Tax=Deinandra increscens subsp. villosa TaxID=3103831 RepID=A0AAP0CDW2_9ASTR
MKHGFNSLKEDQEDQDHEYSPENSQDSPSSGMFNDTKTNSTLSSKRSKRSMQKRVVSVPIREIEGSRLKSEINAPPSDSWAWRKYGQKPIKGSPYPRLFIVHQIRFSSAILDPNDFLALQSISKSLSDMPASKYLSSWDFTSDPCNFAGVFCSGERVVALNLGDPRADASGLSGTLDPAIGKLTNLTEFTVVPGRITGAVPATLLELMNLRGYYRCSSSKGCPARKQVERNRADPTMVIVTYSCDHNHPWPASRNNSQSHNHNITVSPPPASPPTITQEETSNTDDQEEDLPNLSKQSIVDQPEFTNLEVGPFATTTDRYEWFADLESPSSTMLESPLLAGDIVGDADMAMIFSIREEDESLFADLGELPECTTVFRRRSEGINEQTHHLAPWCGTKG